MTENNPQPMTREEANARIASLEAELAEIRESARTGSPVSLAKAREALTALRQRHEAVIEGLGSAGIKLDDDLTSPKAIGASIFVQLQKRGQAIGSATAAEITAQTAGTAPLETGAADQAGQSGTQPTGLDRTRAHIRRQLEKQQGAA